MIINHERDTAPSGNFMQHCGHCRDFRGRSSLCPQLNQVHPAINHLFGDARYLRVVDVTQVEDPVEPAATEIGGGQGQVSYSCNRARVGFNSKLSEFMTRSTKPVSYVPFWKSALRMIAL